MQARTDSRSDWQALPRMLDCRIRAPQRPCAAVCLRHLLPLLANHLMPAFRALSTRRAASGRAVRSAMNSQRFTGQCLLATERIAHLR